MKDVNYNLVKLLHSKLDNVWRLEKFYCSDAEKVNCTSCNDLKKILDDEKRHVTMLTNQIKQRIEKGIFD